jgi:hypothetical protein
MHRPMQAKHMQGKYEMNLLTADTGIGFATIS